MLAPVVSLNEDVPVVQIFYDPSTDEGFLWISHPYISLPGKVILALNSFHSWLAISSVGRFNELWGEGA
jgi:hypothetical protein